MPVASKQVKRLAYLLVVIFIALNTANALNKGGDRDVFFEGGRRILQKLPLYAGSSTADGFIGPPFQALFFAPFAAIGGIAAVLLWYALNLAALAIAIKLTLDAWAIARRASGASLPVVLAPLAAILLPLQTNFEHQNMNTLLLALIAGATLCLTSGSMACAGVLIGIATALKGFPALLIVYLAARGYWRAFVTAVATAGALTALPAFIYGAAGFQELARTWIRLSTSGWPIRGNNQSLIVAIDRFTGAFGAAGVRTTADAPVATTVFVPLVVVLIAAAAVRIVRVKRQESCVLCEISLVTLLSILLSPIAWDHYWTLLFPAFLVLYDGESAGLLSRRARYAFWIAAILTTGLSPLTLGRAGFELARELSANTIAALIIYGGLLMIRQNRAKTTIHGAIAPTR